jgi:hypothetical protein
MAACWRAIRSRTRFFATPKVNRQTKEGKALAEGYRLEAAGRTMFPADWLPGIERIVDNARMHDKARVILGTGEAEVALAWIDPETGIKCKIKIDWWHRTACSRTSSRRWT